MRLVQAEKEQSGDGTEMEKHHEGGGGPDETGLGVGAAHVDFGAGVRRAGGEPRGRSFDDVELTGGGRRRISARLAGYFGKCFQ